MAKRVWLDGLNLALLPFSVLVGVGAYMNRRMFKPTAPVKVMRQAGYNAAQRAALPFISIIVPARNEERNLPRLMPGLLHMDYPADKYEVIVVNDNSDDRSGEILRQFQAEDARLRVIDGEPLPVGWAGKPHALVQGAAVAAGDWLLFTDADTVWQPHALLSALYSAEQHHADLFTAAGLLELGSFWERTLMPIAMLGILALYPPDKVNDPNSSSAIANGQFTFIKRTVYDAVGGFGGVKSEIAEDLEFGKLVKSSGYRLWFADGRNLMAVRMYTDLADVWQGWSKNTALAGRDQPAMLGLGIVALVATGIISPALPFVLAGRLLGRLRHHQAQPADTLALAQSSFQLGMGLVFVGTAQRHLNLPARYLLTLPLGAAVFAAIILNSLYRILSGKGVSWKGRTYKPNLFNLHLTQHCWRCIRAGSRPPFRFILHATASAMHRLAPLAPVPIRCSASGSPRWDGAGANIAPPLRRGSHALLRC